MKNKLLFFILTTLHLIFSINVYSGDAGVASAYIGLAAQFLSNKNAHAHEIIALYRMAMQEHPGGAKRHPQFNAVEAAAKQIEAEFNKHNEQEIQALNNKIKSLEQAANSHQAAATDAQNKLKHTEQARANAVAQYESLQKQATDLHKQKEAISLNLSNSQKLLEALNAEKSNLQKEKAQLSEQYNTTKATLEQKLIALESQKNAEANTLRQQIEQLNTAISQLNATSASEKQALEQQLRQAKSNLENLTKEQNQAKSDLVELTKQHSIATQQLNNDINKLNQQINKLADENKNLQQHASYVAQQLKQLTDANNDLSQKILSLENELESNSVNLKKIEQERDNAIKTLKEYTEYAKGLIEARELALHNAAQKAKQFIEQNLNQQQKLLRDVNSRVQQIGKQTEKLPQYKNFMEFQQSKIYQLRQQIDEINEEKSKLEQELTHLQEDNTNKDNEIFEIRTQIKALNRQIACLDAQLLNYSQTTQSYANVLSVWTQHVDSIASALCISPVNKKPYAFTNKISQKKYQQESLSDDDYDDQKECNSAAHNAADMQSNSSFVFSSDSDSDTSLDFDYNTTSIDDQENPTNTARNTKSPLRTSRSFDRAQPTNTDFLKVNEKLQSIQEEILKLKRDNNLYSVEIANTSIANRIYEERLADTRKYQDILNAVAMLYKYITSSPLINLIDYICATNDYDIDSIRKSVPKISTIVNVELNENDDINSLLNKLNSKFSRHETYLSTRSLIVSAISSIDAIHVYCTTLVSKIKDSHNYILAIEMLYADLAPRYKIALHETLAVENKSIVKLLNKILNNSKITKMIDHFNWHNEAPTNSDFIHITEFMTDFYDKMSNYINAQNILPAVSDLYANLTVNSQNVCTNRTQLLTTAQNYICLCIVVISSMLDQDASIAKIKTDYTNAYDKIQKMLNREIPLRSGWFNKQPVWEI